MVSIGILKSKAFLRFIDVNNRIVYVMAGENDDGLMKLYKSVKTEKQFLDFIKEGERLGIVSIDIVETLKFKINYLFVPRKE